MTPQRVAERLESIDALIEPMLAAARIPGAALAVVIHGETVLARGYGHADIHTRRKVTADTLFPIASTSKAMNATLLGQLVDEGRLGWDVPVQAYLPAFRLGDPFISSQVTPRDLITLRTGLPRHDWLWLDSPMGRAELVNRLRYLDFSKGFREAFQYNNLTAMAAGHLAEVVTGKVWEALIRERLFEPLSMTSTTCERVDATRMTCSYHETSDRQLRESERLATQVAAPSGGAIHSTVADMARWIAFNLAGGKAGNRRLIQSQTLREIHSPQIAVGKDASGPTRDAAYAMGWFVDSYNGDARVSHGGYLHDVNSDVTLFPASDIGMVSFTNFGAPMLARLMNEHTYDLIMGRAPMIRIEEKLAEYEKKIADTRKRRTDVKRVPGTSPSHALEDYAALYCHPGYGELEIRYQRGTLMLRRHDRLIPLEHWHYDAWIAGRMPMFTLHLPHPFDRASRLSFETDADGAIVAFSLLLEPSVRSIRFQKQGSDSLIS